MAIRRLRLKTASKTTRKFFEMLHEHQVSESELSEKTGVHMNTFYGWRSGKSAATVFNLESALSVLGYELEIKPIKKEPGTSK